MAQLDFQPPFSKCDWAHIPLYLLLIIFFPVFMWQQRKRILFSFSNLASSSSLLNRIQNTAWSEEVFISPALALALPVRGKTLNSPEPRGCLVSHCPDLCTARNYATTTQESPGFSTSHEGCPNANFRSVMKSIPGGGNSLGHGKVCTGKCGVWRGVPREEFAYLPNKAHPAVYLEVWLGIWSCFLCKKGSRKTSPQAFPDARFPDFWENFKVAQSW